MNCVSSTVTIKTPFIPSKLIGEGNKLTHLEITKVKSDKTEILPLDQLFVNYGFKSSVGNLKMGTRAQSSQDYCE